MAPGATNDGAAAARHASRWALAACDAAAVARIRSAHAHGARESSSAHPACLSSPDYGFGVRDGDGDDDAAGVGVAFGRREARVGSSAIAFPQSAFAWTPS